MSKVYIKTFGCQMNDRDSEAVKGLFLQKGYRLTDNPDEAEIVLVNTCSVREHAENRALSFLGKLKKLKKKNTKLKVIGLIGCMARNRGEEVFHRMNYVDLVVGPANFDKITWYVEESIRNKKRIIDLADRARKEEFYHSSFRLEEKHAQVIISTGCSNYCSYCVVPYVRGPLRPRHPDDIIKEIKKCVQMGRRKITLLGQNVNDYQYSIEINGKKKVVKFIDLLKMIEKIEGIEEIDFITSHPKNTSLELFIFMANSKKVKKHLHLPFQSGENRILKLMNRGYTRQEYLALTKAYKKIVGGTLSTDVIVGFPTEKVEDFLKTKQILEEVQFEYAYIFKYSPRPQTKAQLLKDDVPAEEKERRHKILLELQKKISLEKKQKSNKYEV